jgi:hypothetical protein
MSVARALMLRARGDAVALTFQEVDRAPCRARSVLAVVVIASEIVVHGAVGQDVIDDPQEGVRQGDHGLFGAAMAQPPSEACLQGALLGPTGAAAASISAVRNHRLPFWGFPIHSMT